MKRFLVLLLAATMLVMGACGGTQPASDSPEGASPSADDSAGAPDTQIGIYDKYESIIDMEAVRNVQLADTEVDFSKSLFIDVYKDTLGINLSYKLQAYGEDYDNKVNLLLATGDLADVMQVNLRQLYQMIDAGQVEDLTSAWNDYATDQTKTAMTIDGTQNFDVATVDGKLYAIPSVDPAIETAHSFFVREDWRNSLGLPEPETFEDFENLIYAFANDDPDGDGQDDTYGLSINKNLFTSGHDVTTFFNLFGAFPNAWIEQADGTLIYGGVMDGMKPALEKLAQYYKDGLIDKEFTAKDESKAAESVPKEEVGAFFGIQWAGFLGDALVSLYKNTDGDATFKSYPIPAATEDGMPIAYNTTSKFYVVRKGYEHPEALVKMLDLIIHYGQGPQGEGPWAIEEESWREIWDVWEEALICPEVIHNNVQRWLDTFDAIETGDTSKIESNYLCIGLYDGLNEWKKDGKNYVDPDTGEPSFDDAASWSNLECCGQTFMNTLASKDAGKLQYDKVGSFISETMLEKQATLDKLELETITRIITGDLPVDEWDNYVTQWYDLGGRQITDEINEWYTGMN